MGQRLAAAVEHLPRDGRRRGLRHFARLMQERAKELDGTLTGVSLTTIQTYLAGTAEPSPTFLEEAAAILGVRAAWLTHGDGAPVASADGPPPEPVIAGHDVLEAAAVARGLTPATRAVLAEAWGRFLAGAPEPLPAPDQLAAGIQLLELVDLPLDLWGFRHDLSAAAMNDYARAMLLALALAMPGPGAGDPMEHRGTVWGSTFNVAKDYQKGIDLLIREQRQLEAERAALQAEHAAEMAALDRLKPEA